MKEAEIDSQQYFDEINRTETHNDAYGYKYLLFKVPSSLRSQEIINQTKLLHMEYVGDLSFLLNNNPEMFRFIWYGDDQETNIGKLCSLLPLLSQLNKYWSCCHWLQQVHLVPSQTLGWKTNDWPQLHKMQSGKNKVTDDLNSNKIDTLNGCREETKEQQNNQVLNEISHHCDSEFEFSDKVESFTINHLRLRKDVVLK